MDRTFGSTNFLEEKSLLWCRQLLSIAHSNASEDLTLPTLLLEYRLKHLRIYVIVAWDEQIRALVSRSESVRAGSSFSSASDSVLQHRVVNRQQASPMININTFVALLGIHIKKEHAISHIYQTR